MKLVITESQLRGIVEMSVSAYQGTPHDFESFDINKVGQGEGSQWFGWGLYFSDSKGIASYYAQSVADAKNRNLKDNPELKYKGKIIKDLFFIINDYRIGSGSFVKDILFRDVLKDLYYKILNYLKGHYQNVRWDNIIRNKQQLINLVKEKYEEHINILEDRLKHENEMSQMGYGDSNSENYREMIEKEKKIYEDFVNGRLTEENRIIDEISNLKESDFSLTSDDDLQKQSYIYDVTLHKNKTPDQYDYLSWYDDLTPNQKQKIINQIKTEKLKKRNFYIVKPTESETEIQPEFFWDASSAKDRAKTKNRKSYIPLLGINVHDFVVEKGTFTTEDLNKSVKDFYTQLSGLLGSPKNASMFLLRGGIDGIKYPSNTIAGGESKGTNYVIFDPKQITIEKKNKVDIQ